MGGDTTSQAKVRSGIGVGTIIEAIRESGLRVGHRAGERGYAALRVRKAEIDQIVVEPPKLKGLEYVTDSAFARQIGMRAKGRFLDLVEAGYTTATQRTDPNTGRDHFYMADVDIAAFHARFVTLSTMTTRYCDARQTLLAKLRSAGIKKFSPKGEDYGHLYLRPDVDRHFGSMAQQSSQQLF